MTDRVPLDALYLFQSHNGAIAAILLELPLVMQLLFQSHNGAIAAWLARVGYNANPGFNPTMVRLLHFFSELFCCLRVVFQSHNGAIAAKAKI